LYVVELGFDGSPRRLELRPAHRELLKYLREQGLLVMAGPWEDDSGALLIFNVDDAAELDQLLEADPYYRAPGVRILRKVPWTPIVS
jgi:uncharacterized protein